jgi:UDPglucose 6-dehydrogenase
MHVHPEPVGVIGTGYVGLVSAVGFAELGHDVYCVEISEAKVAMLRDGNVPFYEPGLEEMLSRYSERLNFSTAYEQMLEHARLLFVSVGTPPDEDGDADLSAVRAVVDAVPASARHALVMKSTVPAGTGTAIKRLLAEQGKQLSYVSCPEFLKEGSAVHDVRNPDRVVIGDDGDWAGDAVAALYEPLCTPPDVPLIRIDITSAEMVKLASNAFLATKISFINEIANVCERVDADVKKVVEGMGPDKRIGYRFLQPGIGYGGSCFAKDVEALRRLARKAGYEFKLLQAGVEVNEMQKGLVVDKLEDFFEGLLEGRTICLLGLAFKPETDDMREASSIVLSRRLQQAGASVRVFDPKVGSSKARRLLGDARFAADALDAAEGAHAVVIVTEWSEFLALDWDQVAERMVGTLVIDGRNALDPAKVIAAGLTYEGMGRGRRTASVAR